MSFMTFIHEIRNWLAGVSYIILLSSWYWSQDPSSSVGAFGFFLFTGIQAFLYVTLRSVTTDMSLSLSIEKKFEINR